MGRQDQFTMNEVASMSNGVNPNGADTVNYITDLLSELQMIANVSGLSNLSDDIRAVLSKHMVQSASV
jgi:hypothetical protein